MVEFTISDLFPAAPNVLYRDWLDSENHSLMTGSRANVSDQVSGEFSAWDGYITGVNLVLEPPHRIVQSWRTQDFTDDDPDSELELSFIPQGGSTLVTIVHTGLPEDGMRYHQGWVEAYFNPMKEFYSG